MSGRSNTESWKFLVLESRALESENQHKDNGIPLTIGINLVPRAFPLKNLREKPWGRGWIGIRNPRSTNNESRTQCLESGIPSVGSRIQGRFPFTQTTSETTSSPHFSSGIVERAKHEGA